MLPFNCTRDRDRDSTLTPTNWFQKKYSRLATLPAALSGPVPYGTGTRLRAGRTYLVVCTGTVYLAVRIADRSPGGPEGEVADRMGAFIDRSARASSSRIMALTSVALAAAEVPG